jgi:hypothetical protein
MSKWNILEYFQKKLKKNFFTKFCFVFFFWGGKSSFGKLQVVFENFNISTNEFRTRIVEYDEVADN